MERKLVKHGPASTILALPAQWVRDQGLRAGDTVSVEPDGDKLIILKRRSDAAATVTITVDSKTNRTTLYHLIRAAYRDGADKILVRFGTKKIIHHRSGELVSVPVAIREEVSRLLGLEVVHQSDGQILLQEITTPNGQELPNLFRKVFTMTRMLIGQIGSAGIDEDIGVEERHNTITKLVSYGVRLVNTGEAGLPGKERARYLHSLMLIDIIIDVLKYYRRENAPKQSAFVAELLLLFGDVERILFGHEFAAFDQFELRKAALRVKPIDRLLPITDVLADMVLLYAGDFISVGETSPEQYVVQQPQKHSRTTTNL